MNCSTLIVKVALAGALPFLVSSIAQGQTGGHTLPPSQESCEVGCREKSQTPIPSGEDFSGTSDKWDVSYTAHISVMKSSPKSGSCTFNVESKECDAEGECSVFVSVSVTHSVIEFGSYTTSFKGLTKVETLNGGTPGSTTDVPAPAGAPSILHDEQYGMPCQKEADGTTDFNLNEFIRYRLLVEGQNTILTFETSFDVTGTLICGKCGA